MSQEPSARTNAGPESPTKSPKDLSEEGGFKGSKPDIFDGDRKKSNVFITDLEIYFRINRNKKDVQNYYSRTLIALSYIKGPKVVNWTRAQIDIVEKDAQRWGEDDKDIWLEFVRRFKTAYVSSTIREDAFVTMQNLRMKDGNLDEYIVQHATLVAELEWEEDGDMSCHSFRAGLPDSLVNKVISVEGLPDNLDLWVKYAQRHHARWAMVKALGYGGRSKDSQRASNGNWRARQHAEKGKRDRDPDCMDVDFARLSPTEKEQLMKEGKCFRCKHAGHLSCNCPQKSEIRKANVDPQEKPNDRPKKEKAKEAPPAYEDLVKGINACSMEDRQKILEALGPNEDEDF